MVRGDTPDLRTALSRYRGRPLGVPIRLAFDLFKDALGEARFTVFASYVPTLADCSPWGELTGVARGFSDAGFSEALLHSAYTIPLPEALLLAGLSWFVLARRSL